MYFHKMSQDGLKQTLVPKYINGTGKQVQKAKCGNTGLL